jgi:hypothetical protein
MATPMSADLFVAALKAEGVKVAERQGWRGHERDDETGRTFGPVHGIVIHHTAGRDSLALCWSGTADLPGPLCHTHLSKTGTATMLSAGRANHAGSFAQNAHAAVLAEAAIHPRPDAAEPVDANDQYYGIEIENLGNGEDPYPTAQYDAAVRWAAAICRAHGWTENSVIGHKEGTRRKIDPSFGMNAFRAAVAARLAHDAGWNPNEEDDMPTAAEVAAEVVKLLPKAVWNADAVPAARPPWHNSDYFKDDGKSLGNVDWNAGYMQRAQVEGIRETLARVKGLEAGAVVDLTDSQLATLGAAVAANPGFAERIAGLVAAELAQRLAE